MDLGGARPALGRRRPGLVDGLEARRALQISSLLTNRIEAKLNQLTPAKSRERNLAAAAVELVPAPLERRAAPGPARRGRARRQRQRRAVAHAQRRRHQVAAAEAGPDLTAGPARPGAAARRRPGGRGRAPVHPPLQLRDVVPELLVHVPAQRAGLPGPRRRRLPCDAARARVAADLPMVVRHHGPVLPQQLHELAVLRAGPKTDSATRSNQTQYAHQGNKNRWKGGSFGYGRGLFWLGADLAPPSMASTHVLEPGPPKYLMPMNGFSKKMLEEE
jgi:hypothetical protein